MKTVDVTCDYFQWLLVTLHCYHFVFLVFASLQLPFHLIKMKDKMK